MRVRASPLHGRIIGYTITRWLLGSRLKLTRLITCEPITPFNEGAHHLDLSDLSKRREMVPALQRDQRGVG